MPEHDDEQMDRVFNDAYAVLIEQAPRAPTFDEITTTVMDPSRVAPLLGHPHQNGDASNRDNPSLGQPVEADEHPGDRSSVDVLWEDVGRPAPSERGRWSGVAMAAAATILVVVGVVLVADGNDSGLVTEPASSSVEADPVPSSSISEPASSAAESDPVPRPSVADAVPPPDVSESGPPPSVVDSLGYRWSRVSDGDAVFGEGIDQFMNAVTAGGPGLVAVGFDRRGEWGTDEPGSAVVWTSVDGITWLRVPHDEAVFGAASMQDVTAGGPGLVAVGHDRGLWSWDNSTGQAPVVWTSVDGLTWSRAPDQVAFGGSNTAMLGVTAGGPGLVAVGFDHGAVAPVWTSVDGVTWSRVADEEALANGTMKSVTAGGPGLVAVGWKGWSTLEAAIWTSVDGITWSSVPYDEVVFDLPELESVTVGGPGLVAVGEGGVIVAERVATLEN